MRPTLEAELDIEAPLPDLEVPPEIELVRLSIPDLGSVELPACDGRVSSWLIADAVAAEFAWPILGRYLKIEDLDRRGWQLFLQEVWGRPDWPESWFYKPPPTGERAPKRWVGRRWTVVEVSEPVPDLSSWFPRLHVAFTVGGVAIGRVVVPAPIPAAKLRARLTTAAGFELCRAAVREGLLGAPLSGPPLRERLTKPRTALHLTPPPGVDFAPGWEQAVHRALGGRPGRVIARHALGEIGSAASRRGVLPSDVEVSGPAVQIPGPGPVAYAPDLLWKPPRSRILKPPTPRSETAYGRHHFESLFARGADPWRYTTPYERTKYEQTMSLIPAGPIAAALEIGCAEGHFTEKLAGRVTRLVAADISEIALGRAAERCRQHGNVEYVRVDLAKDPLPREFGLIVCSETLYFLGNQEALADAARKVADALQPDGHLVMAHANVVADDADRPGFNWDVPYGARTIGETFARTPGLRFLKELRTPLYRVQLFRKEQGSGFEPEQVEEALHADPEPAVAARILWNGGEPVRGEVSSSTDRLPILMYHRVAPEGSPATALYRVTPEAFEEQLRYLRDAGFRSVDLNEWADAMAARRPLPGRAVAFTFDDGYRDFLDWAWPALRRHGFTATVVLVAERIGQINRWDAELGEELPLLDWPEIRRLRDEGVSFGSHGLIHRRLIELPNAEVARVLSRSKSILEKGLERPVTAIAWPWGLSDGAVRSFAGACGYLLGLDSKGGRARLHGNPLNLPRIEVEGTDGLEAFVAKLG